MKSAEHSNTFCLHCRGRQHCSNISMYVRKSSPAALYRCDLACTHRNQTENLLSSYLVACLFSESKHKGRALEVASGKGNYKAEAKSGASGCVSSHRDFEHRANQWHLLETDDDEEDFAEFVTISGYIPAVICQREGEKATKLNFFRNKIKYWSLCHCCRGQKAELTFTFNGSFLSYRTRRSHATLLMQ